MRRADGVRADAGGKPPPQLNISSAHQSPPIANSDNARSCGIFETLDNFLKVRAIAATARAGLYQAGARGALSPLGARFMDVCARPFARRTKPVTFSR